MHSLPGQASEGYVPKLRRPDRTDVCDAFGFVLYFINIIDYILHIITYDIVWLSDLVQMTKGSQGSSRSSFLDPSPLKLANPS